jgi:hypothetical protein
MRRLLGSTAVLVALALLGIGPAEAQTGEQIELGSTQGEPQTFGRDAGYFIWADGDTFHVRWRSGARLRSFSGDISTDGAVRDLKRVDLDPGDVTRRGDSTIVWSARTRGGYEGFSFELSRRADWVRFQLLIDGRLARPDEIHLGRGRARVGSNPFVLRLREASRPDDWSRGLAGRPRFYGDRPGYYVWQDRDGFHVHWTMGGSSRRASGLITTDGRFFDAEAVRFEPHEDAMASDARLIAWETVTADGVDGVRFRVGGSRLTFTLLIDGALASVGRVYLGAGGDSPPRNPFTISR